MNPIRWGGPPPPVRTPFVRILIPPRLGPHAAKPLYCLLGPPLGVRLHWIAPPWLPKRRSLPCRQTCRWCAAEIPGFDFWYAPALHAIKKAAGPDGAESITWERIVLGLGRDVATALPPDPAGLVLEIWLPGAPPCAQQARLIVPAPAVPGVDPFDVQEILERLWGSNEAQAGLRILDPQRPAPLPAEPVRLPSGPLPNPADQQVIADGFRQAVDEVLRPALRERGVLKQPPPTGTEGK